MKKKKRSLWKRLFKRPIILEVKNSPEKCLHVIQVDLDAEGILEALGMTEERKDELVDIALSSYKNSKNLIHAMELASKECKHANEFFFISNVMTKRHEMASAGPGAAIIAQIFGGLQR